MKTGQYHPIYEWLEQDGGQKWSCHLITGQKWDPFIAINWSSEHQTSVCPIFKWFQYSDPYCSFIHTWL
jgi:hypothetical protein